MARQTPDAIQRPFQQARDPQTRCCEWPGCEEDAEHRAPQSRDRLQEYRWFCLEHVREYNKSWNYYAGMSEAEIDRLNRMDTIWQRPTWRLGSGPTLRRNGESAFKDDFGFFREDAEDNARGRQRGPQGQNSEEGRALAALGLEQPVAFAEIKVRYKELVKLLHPDTNGGRPEDEERLKLINQAYATLRSLHA
ncbi:MAG: J domain-containing protein [Rhodovibrionaceae bacterium]